MHFLVTQAIARARRVAGSGIAALGLVAFVCPLALHAVESPDSNSGNPGDPAEDIGPLTADLDFSLAAEPRLFTSADHESISTVLSEVWTTNPQVLQAQSQLTAAGYDVAGAKTGYYPYLQFSSAQGSSNASHSAVSAVQPLWSGGSTRAQVDEARGQADVALADLNQVRLDLGLQVSETYLNVAKAQQQAVIWQRYVDGLNDLLSVIERRADKGASPPVDVETALTRLRAAQAGEAANDAALANSRARLATLLNRDIGGVSWPTEQTRLSQHEVDGLLKNGIIEAHPQRQRALSEVAVQDARARVNKASLWPQINLQHSRLLEQSAGDFTPDSSTQLVFEYQTDNGARGYRGYQAEKQRATGARQRLKFAQLEIANRIKTAQIERDSAATQFRAQTLSAQSAVKLVDSFLRQFKAGRKTWIEVLNAQQEANQALLQAAEVRQAFWIANMRLAMEGMAWERVASGAPPVYLESNFE